MLILAIETATVASSVSLVKDRQEVASVRRNAGRGHEGFLIPAVDFCFEQTGLRPTALDAIVVDTGPGLFTSLRVGLSTAQGFAAGLGVPLVGACSLDALALRAATSHRRIWAVVDVRREEVAAASYLPVPGGVVMDDRPERVGYKNFRGILDSARDNILVVGDWQALPSGLIRTSHRVKTGQPRYPDASSLAELGEGRVERGDFPDEVHPLYMREPDVTLGSVHLTQGGLWGESLGSAGDEGRR